MIRERLGTGVAAASLGILVLIMVLVAGWFGVGRPGGLFGPAPSSGGARVVLVDPGLDLGGSPDAPDAPEAPDAPASPPDTVPAAEPVPAPPVPGPPAPGTPPVVDPPAPPPAPAPADAAPGVVGDTVESAATLTAATVGGVGSTLGDVVAVVRGVLTSPADDAPVTAATEPGETGEAGRTAESGGPEAAATVAPADPEGTPRRGRGLPTTPRIPELPR